MTAPFRKRSKATLVEWLLAMAICTQLQWFFGNLYEEILTPNSIAASIPEINAYNRFFRVTEPYYYYVPLTQVGALLTLFLSLWKGTPQAIRPLLRRASMFGVAALGLTGFIVTQYNLKMFFGSVDHLGALVHRRYLEWALLNAVRLVLVGGETVYVIRAYRRLLKGAGPADPEATHSSRQVMDPSVLSLPRIL